MAAFAALATPEQPVAEVDSIADYELYCHYVAGLVGEGLSGLFSASGKERDFIKDQLTLSNHMGLLLQKTNITRDYREDVDEGRGFWPKAIWSKYGFNKMGDLRDESREQEALFALSEMILDALRHATSSLDYLSLLKNQSVFNFVAIPAVMAIATLERCFMNPDVLRKNVKIRKGEAVQVSRSCSTPIAKSADGFFAPLRNLAHEPGRQPEGRRLLLCQVRSTDSRQGVGQGPQLCQVEHRLWKGQSQDTRQCLVRIDLTDDLRHTTEQIEQWAEHHYPSFVTVGQSDGQVSSSIDVDSGDARAEIYTRIAEDERRRAAIRQQEKMYESMVERGLIKPTKNAAGEVVRPDFVKMREDGTLRAATSNEPVPWLFILSILGGVFAVFAVTGGLLVYVMLTYFSDAE